MLRCLQINLRHSRSAALNLSQLILERKFDVILIQEPYAISSPSLDLFAIPPGYSSHHSLNKDHAFGAAILVKSSLQASSLAFATANHFIGIKLSYKNSVFFLFSLYLRPSLADVAVEMETRLSSIPASSLPYSLICCDANAHSPSWNSSCLSQAGTNVESVISNLHLNIANKNKELLNFVPSGSSFVDITLNGDNTHIENWSFLRDASLSDHPFILFDLRTSLFERSSAGFRRQCVPPPPSLCDLERFYEALPQEIAKWPTPVNISSLSNAEEIDSVIAELITSLKDLAASCKKPRPNICSPSKMPWWSTELQKLKSSLRNASEEKRSNKSDESVEAYRLAKQVYQRELRKAERECWENMCSTELNSDLFAGLKKIANPSSQPPGPPSSLVHEGVSLTEPAEILKAFSSGFFPSAVSDSEQHTSVVSEVSNSLAELTSPFPEISLKELEEVFSISKKTKSPGQDGFSPLWLATSFELIKNHILAIFNHCLKFNYFPRNWKVAAVLILKKANKAVYNLVSSFRPISILNALSKLFEKIILARLNVLAAEQNWFSENQHGFCAGKSTETATLSLVSTLEKRKAANLFSCVAFLDIKSAFDAAWHPAILHSLLKKGCPLYLVKILRSFLRDRSAKLEYMGISISSLLSVGCPQGSVLSPFLWNILIDFFLRSNFSFLFKIIAYADDLILITSAVTLELAVKNLQLMCDAAAKWGLEVKLAFNGAKTVFMVFCKQRKFEPVQITVGGTCVSPVDHCTYLGCTIDNRLSWQQHIQSKCVAAKRAFFSITHCFRKTWGLSRSKLQLFYKSVFLPILLYNCSVWAKSSLNLRCATLLKSTQRPFLLSISKCFKSTASSAAAVIANVLPIDLKIAEVVLKRSFSPATSNLIPKSTKKAFESLVAMVHSTLQPIQQPTKAQLSKAICDTIAVRWEAQWRSDTACSITHLFLPLVSNASILDVFPPSLEAAQLLSGHCKLRQFLFKIKKCISPVCLCGEDEETVLHFLFHCPRFAFFRLDLIDTFEKVSDLSWPPTPALVVSNKKLWLATLKFIKSSKRFINLSH